MVKTIIAFCVIFSLTGCGDQHASGQMSAKENPLSAKKGDPVLNEEVPEYYVDTCLSKFLIAIVKSNAKHYMSGKYFYSLSWKKDKKYRYLNISRQLWESPEKVSYEGAIKLEGGTFLCRGDFRQDPIFHQEKNYLSIKLKVNKDSNTSIPIPEDPVIQGVFDQCEGLPIYAEIYTKEEIPGYKMHFRQ
jgi:hypothetical protein